MIYSAAEAFAAKMMDGSVVTWGRAGLGGDSSAVQTELKQGVDMIYSTYFAFAARMMDGSVVTWGDADFGGDSSSVYLHFPTDSRGISLPCVCRSMFHS
jgi:hypothetical protein